MKSALRTRAAAERSAQRAWHSPAQGKRSAALGTCHDPQPSSALKGPAAVCMKGARKGQSGPWLSKAGQASHRTRLSPRAPVQSRVAASSPSRCLATRLRTRHREVPQGRQSLARGVSPWTTGFAAGEAPKGRPNRLPPLRGLTRSAALHTRGLRPWLMTIVPPGLRAGNVARTCGAGRMKTRPADSHAE